MASVRFLDLFSGCGGMTRGFLDIPGFRTAGAVEFDYQAAATYAANFGEKITFFGDIADYTEVPKVDLVIGGPPCQGFSNLGKKDPEDSRNSLFREFVRVVVESGADMFVFENVNRFAASTEAKLLAEETREGGALEGFELQTFLVNAADFGTSQKRHRTVIVGSRIGLIAEPEPTHSRVPTLTGLAPWATVRDAFTTANLSVEVEKIALPDQSDEVLGKRVAGPFKLSEIHVGRTYQEKSIERYGHIAPGRGRLDLPWDLQYDCWKKLGSRGASDVLGRLEWDAPSVTIRTEFFKPEKGRYLHPEWSAGGLQANRAITHAEAAALQGFDERHLWCGTKVGIARQIGNAVPPPLARAIALQIKARFKNPLTA
jgi:DNA (cytosine-5)-methyltransferase 1